MLWKFCFCTIVTAFLTSANFFFTCGANQVTGVAGIAGIVEIQELKDIKQSIDDLKGSTQQDVRNLREQLQALKTLMEQNARRHHIPVFHVHSSEGRYKLSLNQAKQACIDRNAKIATPAQLRAAWEDGLDVCAFGWASDGKIYLPIRYPRPGCWGSRALTTGHKGWIDQNASGKADVYCFKM
ncbi:aggrecan core protein-like [Lingula anatina]|uniref:Aggrecan core protein-like n=1 Tax=Lingula anatina TaxID=7574 RepID=A0A1S3IZK4_LINAN|nr:aggrecan core protein-like [Lingula anatina]|eukprot:XP_013403431.1 aggrecan core protein-like [Lingula anatina]